MKNEQLLKLTIILGCLLVAAYGVYRVQLITFEPYIVVFSILLFLAELHTIIHFYGLFYILWPRKYITYEKEYRNENIRINIFICVCGESTKIVKKTIVSAQKAVRAYTAYANPLYMPNIIVLNDGYIAKKRNWRYISQICKTLLVKEIIRTTPGGFKAGNINNGIKLVPTSSPFETIDVVLDADYIVKEEFLREIVKPFIDKSVDFVQSPQWYYNQTSWVAKAAAAHQMFFFDYVCPAKGHDNAIFLCGTNFAIRREALNSVAGLDTRFITEDYASSLKLHLIGKKGVYLPKVLARGLAPSTLKAYFTQQQRWSKGNLDVAKTYARELILGELSLKQKFHYLLSATYYFTGMRDLILILAPLFYLLTGMSLVKGGAMPYMLFFYIPFIAYSFIMYICMFKHPLKSLILDIACIPIFVDSFVSSMLGKNLRFIVTAKNHQKENVLSVYKNQLTIIAFLIVGLYNSYFLRGNTSSGALINYFWVLFECALLSLGFLFVVKENYKSPLLLFPNNTRFVKTFDVILIATLTYKMYFTPFLLHY